MPVPDMHLNTAFVFSLMWAIRTLELRFLTTLKSNMPHHVLLVSITLATCHTLECLLSAMIHNLLTLHSYRHEWQPNISIRSSKLPCHGSTNILSVRMLITMAAGQLNIQVLFKFYCTMLLKFTFCQFCNTTV
jgi:hypothetical protein